MKAYPQWSLCRWLVLTFLHVIIGGGSNALPSVDP